MAVSLEHTHVADEHYKQVMKQMEQRRAAQKALADAESDSPSPGPTGSAGVGQT